MKESIFITAGLSVVLAACSTNGTLQSSTGDTSISGTITRGLFEPHRIDVTLDGKSYYGEWRTSAPTQEQYTATAWPHKKHVGQVQSLLVADSRSKLDCRWITHGETGTGYCASRSHEYPLMLK